MKRIILVFLLISLTLPLYSAVLLLKNGKTIEGRIIEATTEYIKIDLYGKSLTYNLGDIESIDGKKIIFSPKKSKNQAAADRGKEFYSLLSEAQKFLREQQYQQAIAAYEKAILINKDSAVAYNGLAIAYLSSGKLNQAIVACNRGIEVNPSFANIYGIKGQAYFYLRDYSQAQDNLLKAKSLIEENEALRDNEQSRKLIQHVDLILKAIENQQRSMDQEYVTVAPPTSDFLGDDFLSHLNLGKDYINSSQHLLAVGELKEAVKINPDSDEAYNYLAQAYEGLSRNEQALSAYEKAIEINPESTSAFYNLAILYSNKFKDIDKAIESLEIAVSIDFEYAEAYHNLGLLYKSLGKYSQAGYNLKKSKELFNKRGDEHNAKRLERDIQKLALIAGTPKSSGKRAFREKGLNWKQIFSIFSIFLLGAVYYGIYFYTKKMNMRTPLNVIVFGGWVTYTGLAMVIGSFILNMLSPEHSLGILMNIVLLISGVVTLYAGIAIIHLQPWSRTFILWTVVISGIIESALVLLETSDSIVMMVVVTVHLIHFTAFYYGLPKKYFDSRTPVWFR